VKKAYFFMQSDTSLLKSFNYFEKMLFHSVNQTLNVVILSW